MDRPYANLSDVELIREYKRHKSKYMSGYMGEKRKALVDKFGFDVKNASHLVRLYKMGIEFLRCGTLTVHRPDWKELLRIKRGEYSLDTIISMAADLEGECKEALRVSALKERPNFIEAEVLLMEMFSEYFGIGNGE